MIKHDLVSLVSGISEFAKYSFIYLFVFIGLLFAGCSSNAGVFDTVDTDKWFLVYLSASIDIAIFEIGKEIT